MKKKVGSDGKADSVHYGGADNPHETIKCLRAWGLEKDALCWTTGKYLSRAGKKEGATLLRDLEKAHFYLGKKIERLKEELETHLKDEVERLVQRPRRRRRRRMSDLERTARALGVVRGRQRLKVGRTNA